MKKLTVDRMDWNRAVFETKHTKSKDERFNHTLVSCTENSLTLTRTDGYSIAESSIHAVLDDIYEPFTFLIPDIAPEIKDKSVIIELTVTDDEITISSGQSTMTLAIPNADKSLYERLRTMLHDEVDIIREIDLDVNLLKSLLQGLKGKANSKDRVITLIIPEQNTHAVHFKMRDGEVHKMLLPMRRP